MNKKEKELFKELCSFMTFDDERLGRLLTDSATAELLGQLHINRMQGVALESISRLKERPRLCREFINSLKAASEQSKKSCERQLRAVNELTRLFEGLDCKYAFLKGAVLCREYPSGLRCSNDIDILVDRRDIDRLGDRLRAADFVQGRLENGALVPASRSEIIASRVNRGETVPYIRIAEDGKYTEVDLNFSLSFKNGDGGLCAEMLDRVERRRIGAILLNTLSEQDFLIHLCCHLYKEATTLPWILMKRDMTLYKYCDIYFLLNRMGVDEVDRFFERLTELGTERECVYALLSAAELFKGMNLYAVLRARELAGDAEELLCEVTSPSDGRRYRYRAANIEDRLFARDRTRLLREVK